MSRSGSSDRLRLELGRARVPFAWVVLLLIAGAFATWVLFRNQTFSRPWESTRTYRIAVQDAKGVNAGAQKVRMAGVEIGVVTRSDLRDGRPVLTLELDDDAGPLYRDARVRLRPLTPLQDIYVAVEDRGTKAAGDLGDRVLPVDQAETPVDLSRVLNAFEPDTRRMMQVTLRELAKGAPDNGRQLNAAFAELAPFLQVAARTSGAVTDRRRAMRRLVTSMAGLTGALATRDRQLRRVIEAGNGALGQLAADDAPFAATLRELPDTMAALRSSFSALRGAQDELDPALGTLDPVARELRAGSDALGRFAEAAEPALARLRDPLVDLRALSRELRPTSTALAGAVATLRPQAPSFDRITKLVPGCFDHVSRFFNDTLSVFKFSDAYGTIARGNNTVGVDSVGGTGTADLRQPTPCTEATR